MRCETVLEIHGKTSKEIITRNLTELGQTLFEDKLSFTNNMASRITPEIPNRMYRVQIAQGWLTYDCNNAYNRAGYVFTVQHMYHEYRHIQHCVKEWNDTIDIKSIKNINRMTDIVRRNFVRNFYESAYTHNYTKDPGEIDAETYGLQQAVIYFKDDPLITQKEAKDILFEFMMSEDYGHKKELDKYGIKSFDDMMPAFADFRNAAIHYVYPVTTDISPLIGESIATNMDMTEEFLNSYKYRTYRDELKKCKDGKEIDKLLEQTIVLKYPDIIESVPRLQNELTTCKKQMDSRIIMPKRYAIPISKINYAGQNELSEIDEFTASVKEISENTDITAGI